MIPNESEISRITQDYIDKARAFPALVKSMSDNEGTPMDSDKRSLVMGRSAQLRSARDNASNGVKTSSTERLYRALAKNGDSMRTYGAESFPAVTLSTDSSGSATNIAGMSNLHEAVVGSYGELESLGLSFPTYKSGAHTIHPCVVNHGEGETLPEYFRTKPAGVGLEAIEADPLTRKDVDICEGSHPSCSDCIDCGPHREELIKAVQGLYTPGEDGMRVYHAKNLISTLESWAAHHDTKGSTESSCATKEFNNRISNNGCNHKHQHMARNLRMLASKFREALQKDGIPHRDNFQGKNKDAF